MKTPNAIIVWLTNHLLSELLANNVFIYANPLISFCIDNLCYLLKLFNTALYETGLGHSFLLDQCPTGGDYQIPLSNTH